MPRPSGSMRGRRVLGSAKRACLLYFASTPQTPKTPSTSECLIKSPPHKKGTSKRSWGSAVPGKAGA